MTRVLKILGVIFIGCLCQTNLANKIRFSGIAPDFIAVVLVSMSRYYGTFGGICAGMIIGMLYDSTVGYVLALDLVAYTAIGYFAPFLYRAFQGKYNKRPYESIIVLSAVCFMLSLGHELLNIGYLFLIGAQQSLVITIIRALIGSMYSTVWVVPVSLLLEKLFAKPSVDTEHTF